MNCCNFQCRATTDHLARKTNYRSTHPWSSRPSRVRDHNNEITQKQGMNLCELLDGRDRFIVCGDSLHRISNDSLQNLLLYSNKKEDAPIITDVYPPVRLCRNARSLDPSI